MTETPSSVSRPRVRRVLAVVAGVAAVPALYAVANAAIDTSPTSTSAHTAATITTARERATESEHGATTTTPDDRGVDADEPDGVEPGEHPVPEPEPAEGNEIEVEHGVATTQPHGGEGRDDPPVSTVPTAQVTQTFTSAGGSITVTLAHGVVSLDATSPAPGFSVEVHDVGPDRVEVRFTNAGIEWRIRVEPAGASMSVEITQHD